MSVLVHCRHDALKYILFKIFVIHQSWYIRLAKWLFKPIVLNNFALVPTERNRPTAKHHWKNEKVFYFHCRCKVCLRNFFCTDWDDFRQEIVLSKHLSSEISYVPLNSTVSLLCCFFSSHRKDKRNTEVSFSPIK